jgi:signal peptide peptidase SppA
MDRTPHQTQTDRPVQNTSGLPWAVYRPALQLASAGAGAPGAWTDAEPCEYEVVAGVAVLEIVGLITPAAPRGFGTTTSAVDVQVALSEALDDDAVKSIALYIDSPGGSTRDVQQCADAIYAARSKKPVTAICANMACSAGYWLASQADRVTANAAAIVGSIGTFCVLTDLHRMFKAAGVDVHLITSGPEKGAGALGTEITAVQIAGYQAMVLDLTDVFVAAVARGRGISIQRAKALASGAVWVGAKAQEAGLIDAVEDDVKTLSGMIRRAASPGQTSATRQPSKPPDAQHPPTIAESYRDHCRIRQRHGEEWARLASRHNWTVAEVDDMVKAGQGPLDAMRLANRRHQEFGHIPGHRRGPRR